MISDLQDDFTPQPLLWQRSSNHPLDYGGPSSRFTPLEGKFTNIPIWESFQQVASRYADNIAVADGDVELTYREILNASRNLAQEISAGTPPGSAVGLLLPNCALAPVAILACLAADRPYVALDVHYPVQRNAHIIAESGLSALIVHDRSGTADLLVPGIRCFDLSQTLDKRELAPDLNCTSRDVDAPAIILYTSGSTGHPKGIVNAQRAVLQRVLQYVNSCHIDCQDVILQLSSFCTIAGNRESFAALLTGARLCIVDPQTTGLRAIRRLIGQQRVTIAYSVPALFRSIVEAQDCSDELASIRILRLGGDKVLWADAILFQRLLPTGCLLQIGYSSTETTGAQWFVPHVHPTTDVCVPIGYMLPGIEFAVVDEDDIATAAGEVGELVVRSPYVALGEWRNGHLAQGAMTVDPASPDLRIFHTGDLVRSGRDGLMELVGRKDQQIKINGKRIEPAELESVLRCSPKVTDAAVIVQRDGTAVSLVAFVAAVPNTSEGLRGELRTTIRQALPSALHPTRLHVLDTIPRLPSAKLDLAALRKIDEAIRLVEDRTEPAEPWEVALPDLDNTFERLWRKVLGSRRVTKEVTWDEAGGDSLKLLRLTFEFEEEVGYELPIGTLQSTMTYSEMGAAANAAITSHARGEVEDDSRPKIFFFPGLGSDTAPLASFRADVMAEVQFELVKYPSWREMAEGLDSIERIAERAVQQITASAATGDLLIAGYSFGGSVAFETASQLLAMGRTITFFGVLDTDISGTVYRNEKARLLSNLRQHAHNKGLLNFYQYGFRRLARWLGDPTRKYALQRLSKSRLGLLPDLIRFILEWELTEVLQMKAHRRWIKGASGEHIFTHAVLFRSEAMRPGVPLDLGWGKRFEALEVVEVPGDHFSMLSLPHRTELCAQFSHALAQRFSAEHPSSVHGRGAVASLRPASGRAL